LEFRTTGEERERRLISYDRLNKCGVKCDEIHPTPKSVPLALQAGIGCTHGCQTAQPWSLQMLSGFVVRNYYTTNVNNLKLPRMLVNYIRKMNMLSFNVDTGRISSRYSVA